MLQEKVSLTLLGLNIRKLRCLDYKMLIFFSLYDQELTSNLPYDPSEDYLTCGNTYMCQFGENPGESTTTQATTASTTTCEFVQS